MRNCPNRAFIYCLTVQHTSQAADWRDIVILRTRGDDVKRKDICLQGEQGSIDHVNMADGMQITHICLNKFKDTVVMQILCRIEMKAKESRI